MKKVSERKIEPVAYALKKKKKKRRSVLECEVVTEKQSQPENLSTIERELITKGGVILFCPFVSLTQHFRTHIQTQAPIQTHLHTYIL